MAETPKNEQNSSSNVFSLRGIFTPKKVLAEHPSQSPASEATRLGSEKHAGQTQTGTNVEPQANEPFTPKVVAEQTGLTIESIGKIYGKRPVVREVSLNVKRGEVVGLLGPNGAGKTTTFYMITGLIVPDYGTITLDGEEVTELPMYVRARMGIGYLPQEASIFRGMTVEQNIMAVLEVEEPVREERQRRLDQLLAEFSITHLRSAPAITLSGGERRRVEIARALASNPSFILLDEPLAGIDPIAVSDIRKLVRHLKDRGLGVIITDHNVRETLELIDRAYIIHDGTVLMDGTPEEIIGNEDVRRVYLGDYFNSRFNSIKPAAKKSEKKGE